MTPEQLAAACDINPLRAAVWAPLLAQAVARWKIQRVPQFVAQCCHESRHFSRLEEDLSYSAERMLAVWPRRFTGLADAEQYARKPRLLANRVYANRLGNGGPESNDGWQYRGRGLLQLTGRANYSQYAVAAGYDVITNPDRIAQDWHLAADSAGWFWATHQLDALSDITAITRAVNGGTVGLDHRAAMTVKAMQVFGDGGAA
jgi:putative chitinase